jgi:hypothetical protein
MVKENCLSYKTVPFLTVPTGTFEIFSQGIFGKQFSDNVL